MLQHPAVAALNHLLKEQRWARETLRPYAGKCVVFRLDPLPDLRLRINESGMVESAAADAAADLTVTVQPGAVPHLLARDQAAMAHVDLAGPVDLAAAVQMLFRDLRWDAEEDLSRLVGDVLAHRIVATATDVLAWQKDAALRLGQNVSEYLLYEQPMLASAEQVDTLRRNLDKLNEDCARLERRLALLEARTKRTRS